MSSEDNKPVNDDILVYRFFEDAKICVISLGGNLNYKNKESCEAILEQIKKSKAPVFVMNFRDVQKIDKNIHRYLVQLQTLIRTELHAEVRICEMKTTFKSDLLDIGIIKASEYFLNLREALVGAKR